MRARKTAIRRAVVDTSPLVSALVLEYVRRKPPSWRSPILSKSRLASYLESNEARQRQFIQYFDAIQSILTTSHVIGEIQGLQSKLDGRYRQEFWLGGISFLRRKKLDERLVGLLQIASTGETLESLCSLGPTDTGLIDLARREGCILLTDDTDVWHRAKQLQVDCKLIRAELQI